MDTIFYNRDLSWLEFNGRVLQEAQDQTVPLVQRLRFSGIFDNNQDEFIKDRLANLIRTARLKGQYKFSDGQKAKKLLPIINGKIEEYQNSFIQVFTTIQKELEQHKIFLKNETNLSEKQQEFCRDYFSTHLSSQISSIVLREDEAIPFLTDNNIYLGVQILREGKNTFAIVQIPLNEHVSRFVELPSVRGTTEIIFVEDIVRQCLDEIFFMFHYDGIAAYGFKFYRDASYEFDDNMSKNLFRKLREDIRKRANGEVVKLLVNSEMPGDLQEILTRQLGLKHVAKYPFRYLHLSSLMKFPKVDSKLEYETQKPLLNPDIQPFKSVFEAIGKRDILLHYPYQTYRHLIDFMHEASADPAVTSIKIALYRTADHSEVINYLINAARNGKKVTVVMELMASFDEEQNMDNAAILRRAGIQVVFGPKKLKVHSKIMLVERKEDSGLQHYAYISTGNFNENTAFVYSDLGLFTVQPKITSELRQLFDFLIKEKKEPSCRKLLVSPFEMRKKFEKLIQKEIKNAKNGLPAFIDAKMNGLTDDKMIKLLYKAGQAGVKIRLIVRSACCLVPLQTGLSENIEVRGIVDKYLEHSRIFIFHNNKKEKIYIGSADWMTRNLDRRVETDVQILDDDIKDSVKQIFEIQWSDNTKARNVLTNDYVKTGTDEPHRAQMELYEFYKK